MLELSYRTFASSITMYAQSFIYTRLMNDLGYDQFSNYNLSLKLVLIRAGNHRELLQYFNYFGQGFHLIKFLKSISTNTKGG